MFWAIFLTGLSTLFTIYIIWALKKASYWKDRGINGPNGIFPFGLFIEISDPKRPWAAWIPEFTKKYGNIWGYLEGVYPILVVADLELTQEVLHARFEEFQRRKGSHLLRVGPNTPRVHLAEAWGQRWKRLRTIVTPQFSNNSLKRVHPIVNDSANHLAKHIGKHSNKEETINIHRFYQEYTMDVIARVAMGQKESLQWESEFTDILRGVFNRNIREPFFLIASIMPIFQPVLSAIFKKLGQIFKMPTAQLTTQIEKAVSERKRLREQGIVENNDFIDLFLDAEAKIDHSTEGAYDRKEIHISRKLTEDEVIAQCFVFLSAGFDTTANSLAYVSHLLAQDKEVQDRLREEIDQICTDEDITYDQLTELKYMDCVAKEGLRLHPLAAIAVSRVAEKDCELKGIKIDKGTVIQIDAYSLQRSKEIWGADADDFIPERWMNLTKEQHQAYLSFGAGPRMCVGNRLAYMEEKMALAMVLRKYELIAPCVQKEPLVRGIGIVQPVSIDLFIRPRK